MSKFLGFGKQESSYSENSQLASSLPPLFKGLTKKASATKLKSLQGIVEVIKKGEVSEDQFAPFLKQWTKSYSLLTFDLDRSVRAAANETFVVIVELVKKHLAKELKSLMGMWLLNMFDFNKDVSQAAKSAFETSFQANKRSEALLFCKTEILATLSEYLSYNIQTFPAAQNLEPSQKEEIYQRITSSSLRALAYCVEIFPKDDITIYDSCVGSKLWDFFSPKSIPMIRTSLYELISSFCIHIPSLISFHLDVLSGHILGVFHDISPNTHSALWSMILIFLKKFPESWSKVNIRKAILPKLWSFLDKGSYGGNSHCFRNLPEFLSVLPDLVLGKDEGFFCEFFSHFWKFKSSQAFSKQLDLGDFLTCFRSCFRFALLYSNQHHSPISSLSLLRQSLTPVLQYFFQENLGIHGKILIEGLQEWSNLPELKQSMGGWMEDLQNWICSQIQTGDELFFSRLFEFLNVFSGRDYFFGKVFAASLATNQPVLNAQALSFLAKLVGKFTFAPFSAPTNLISTHLFPWCQLAMSNPHLFDLIPHLCVLVGQFFVQFGVENEVWAELVTLFEPNESALSSLILAMSKVNGDLSIPIGKLLDRHLPDYVTDKTRVLQAILQASTTAPLMIDVLHLVMIGKALETVPISQEGLNVVQGFLSHPKVELQNYPTVFHRLFEMAFESSSLPVQSVWESIIKSRGSRQEGEKAILELISQKLLKSMSLEALQNLADIAKSFFPNLQAEQLRQAIVPFDQSYKMLQSMCFFSFPTNIHLSPNVKLDESTFQLVAFDCILLHDVSDPLQCLLLFHEVFTALTLLQSIFSSSDMILYVVEFAQEANFLDPFMDLFFVAHMLQLSLEKSLSHGGLFSLSLERLLHTAQELAPHDSLFVSVLDSSWPNPTLSISMIHTLQAISFFLKIHSALNRFLFSPSNFSLSDPLEVEFVILVLNGKIASSSLLEQVKSQKIGHDSSSLRLAAASLSMQDSSSSFHPLILGLLEKPLDPAVLHGVLIIFSSLVEHFSSNFASLSKDSLEIMLSFCSSVHSMLFANHLESILSNSSLMDEFVKVVETTPVNLIPSHEPQLFRLLTCSHPAGQHSGYVLLFKLFSTTLIQLGEDGPLMPSLLKKVIENPTKSVSFSQKLSLCLSWLLLARLFIHQNNQVKLEMISYLREFFVHFLNQLRQWLHLPQPKQFVTNSWIVSRDLVLDAIHDFCPFSTLVFFKVAQTFPSLLRSWWTNELTRPLAQQVEEFTISTISPQLIEQEMLNVSKHKEKYDNFTLRANSTVNEIVFTYEQEDINLEVVLKIPNCYPLKPVSVDFSQKSGIGESHLRKWILSLKSLIATQDNNLLAVGLIWKTKLDQHFEGVETCPICYSLLLTGSKMVVCGTCKNKYHSACVYKYVRISKKSDCPLCRSNLL